MSVVASCLGAEVFLEQCKPIETERKPYIVSNFLVATLKRSKHEQVRFC